MQEPRYRILKPIDQGGMAEIWKGKASIQGFERIVAIKRILPKRAKDKGFLEMFQDEACLLLHLNHANVVQTLDAGVSEGVYFIVMEWLDGPNLKRLLENTSKAGKFLDVRIAVFIAAEVCKGLSHAHNRCDLEGRPLHIVHRDISPPNIIITREGEVKLIDFGLAKTDIQHFNTDQGVVKGKFSYLSPEVAYGRPVDPRTDIFALGAVLWEMLAGRRLFDGASDRETVNMIRQANVPSLRTINPAVDAELDAIVQHSLTRDPKDRFQTAEEMGRALTDYLFSHRLSVANYSLADLLKQYCTPAPAVETAKQRQVNASVQEQLANFKPLSLEERLQKLANVLEGLNQQIFIPASGATETANQPHLEPSSGLYDNITVGSTPAPETEKRHITDTLSYGAVDIARQAQSMAASTQNMQAHPAAAPEQLQSPIKSTTPATDAAEVVEALSSMQVEAMPIAMPPHAMPPMAEKTANSVSQQLSVVRRQSIELGNFARAAIHRSKSGMGYLVLGGVGAALLSAGLAMLFLS